MLKEIYSLVGDGDQMALIFNLESKLSDVTVPISILSFVYDRVKDD